MPALAAAVSLGATRGLPAPVQRYLRLALRDGQPRPATVRLQQSGRLRTGVESEQWLDFTAEETIAPEARGFVWDARIRLAPFVHAEHPRRLRRRRRPTRAWPCSRPSRSRPIAAATISNSGDLYRLLAEAPWSPTLLLPREGLTWTAIDDHRAAATLTHGGETVTIEFRFNDAGEVASVYRGGAAAQLRHHLRGHAVGRPLLDAT